MPKYLQILFVLAILVNISLAFYFRFRLDAQYRKQQTEFILDSSKSLTDLTVLVLEQVRNTVASNILFISSNYDFDNIRPHSVDSVGDTNSSDTVFFKVMQPVNYHYYEIDNEPYAQIGINHYGVYCRYPRGGIITAITSDSIIVDDKYLYPCNPVKKSSSLSSDLIPSQQKELVKNE